MSVTTAAQLARRKRRMVTYGWIFGLTILTISLIYWEKTALLYILATVGITALLIVVAMADLAHAENMTEAATPVRSGGADNARR
jgi:hypothetical protein